MSETFRDRAESFRDQVELGQGLAGVDSGDVRLGWNVMKRKRACQLHRADVRLFGNLRPSIVLVRGGRKSQ